MTMSSLLRRTTGALALLLAVLGVALWSAGAVSAHAELLGVDPPDGAVVQGTPAQVTLRFSEHVSLTGGSARVLDQQATVVSGEPRVDGDDVVIPLGGDLPDGTYTVTWVAISEDSHPVSGATVFSIGAPSAGGGAAVVPPTPSAGWGVRFSAGALVAVTYAGALLAVGGWWFLVVVARGGDDDEHPYRVKVRGMVSRAAVLGAVAAVASIPLRIARVGGGLGALRENDLLGEALRGPIGVSTAVTAGGLLVLAGLIEPGSSARRRSAQVAALVVGFVAIAGFSIEGHTRSQHPIPLMITFDVIHLVAGAVWLGGIACLVMAYRSGPHPDVLARVVGRFSAMAVFAVAAVLAAGTGMAILVLPTFSDLFTTGYGLTLLVKVALVLPVVGLGAYNHRRLVPAMSGGAAAAPERRRRLGSVVTIELAVLIVVLGVTAVLVNRSPVAASAAAPAPVTTAPPSAVDVPLSSSAGTATYSFVPALPGQNEMVLTLKDANGQPLEPIEDPTVELTEPQLGVGPLRPIVHPLGGGEYHVIADVPLAGTYDMVIRVRVSNFEAVSAQSQVVIAK
jgi:copper transport protein